MTHLIGLGISLAVFLVIWIIRMMRDGYYSSPFGEDPTELARVFSIVLALVVAIVAPFFLSFLWRPFGPILGIVIFVICVALIVGNVRKNRKKSSVWGMIIFLALCVISCVVIAFSFRESGLRLMWLGGAAIIALILTGMIPLLRDMNKY